MLFNSLHFAAFFPVVAAAYFGLPHRWRWALLLATSYYFYAVWEPGYLILLWVSTVTVYATGLLMGRTAAREERRPYLLLSLGINLGLLFLFKYYNFFSDVLRPLLGAWALPHSGFLLPIGISFYTFQALSYTIEVYRGNQAAERHLGRFALYVAFFPTVLSGPIERPGRLLPQFLERHDFAYERVTNGLKLMTWGLFQKVVIADRLAEVVNNVYGEPTQFPGPALAVATLFFAFQLYCDFSGYSDMAIGAAQVLGITVMDNFRRPYFATSIADFWRRWHISLSSWLRDYLYIPLGGNQVALPRWCANILVVFLLCGLWHGANWTFVLWGLLHACYVIAGRVSGAWRQPILGGWPKVRQAIHMVVTFALVCFAWIFFRAQTVGDALYIVGHLPTGWAQALDPNLFGDTRTTFGVWARDWWLSIALIGLVIGVQVLQSRGNLRERIARQPWWIRWSLYSAALWGIFLFGALRQTEFYYFQF